MRVIKVEPNKAPRTINIDGSLSSLQSEVEGCIEAVYPFDDEVAIVCNEDGKMIGMELNRALRDDDGNIYDIICGSFLVVGLTEDDFGGLSDELLDKYMKVFERAEEFLVIGNKIISI